MNDVRRKLLIAGILLAAALTASGIALYTIAQAAYPLVVQDAWTSSEAGGAPQDTFPVGSLVFLNEQLFYPETYDGTGMPLSFLYAVTITDPNNTPLVVAVGAGTINPGDTLVVSAGGSIPFGSPPGTYTASGLVMNGFPSQMGPDWELYAEPVDVTFTVTS